MEEDNKFYLFKALGFNIAKSKFDTKGCTITGIPEPVDSSDVISLEYFTKQLENLNNTIKNLKETQKQFKNDVKEIESRLQTTPKSSTELTSKDNTVTKLELVNELEKLNACSLREITYEIIAKKTSVGSFSIPKRLVDSITNRNSLSLINIYSNIELISISSRLAFFNANNKEVHVPDFKTKKKLKEPLVIAIKSRKDSAKAESNLYSLSVSNVQSIHTIDTYLSLDNKFLDRVRVEPDNLSNCFVVSAAERSSYPEVREIVDGVENITLMIIFLIRLNYRFSSGSQAQNEDE